MTTMFRVTVEDLDAGIKTTMEIAEGDYVLIPFAPCYLAGSQVYPKAGTHVLTIKDYRPAAESRQVTP